MARSVIQLGALLLLVVVQCASAAYWGDFGSECVRFQTRKWYSRLWGIKGDWSYACHHTPATVANVYFASPDTCVDKGAGGMWGEFYVTDYNCNSLWSGVHKTEDCSASKPGFGKFVAKLELPAEDVSNDVFNLRGKSLAWASLMLCRGKEAIIEGVHFDRPDQCVFKGAEGMFGEFFIRDSSCDVEVV